MVTSVKVSTPKTVQHLACSHCNGDDASKYLLHLCKLAQRRPHSSAEMTNICDSDRVPVIWEDDVTLCDS